MYGTQKKLDFISKLKYTYVSFDVLQKSLRRRCHPSSPGPGKEKVWYPGNEPISCRVIGPATFFAISKQFVT